MVVDPSETTGECLVKIDTVCFSLLTLASVELCSSAEAQSLFSCAAADCSATYVELL